VDEFENLLKVMQWLRLSTSSHDGRKRMQIQYPKRESRSKHIVSGTDEARAFAISAEKLLIYSPHVSRPNVEHLSISPGLSFALSQRNTFDADNGSPKRNNKN
jgi:hypothetical protein